MFQQVMKDMLKEKEFTVLILIPSDDATSISDLAWNIENVCVLEVPNQVWDEAIWDQVFSGIQLNSQDKSLSEQARCVNDFNNPKSCSRNKRS